MKLRATAAELLPELSGAGMATVCGDTEMAGGFAGGDEKTTGAGSDAGMEPLKLPSSMVPDRDTVTAFEPAVPKQRLPCSDPNGASLVVPKIG